MNKTIKFSGAVTALNLLIGIASYLLLAVHQEPVIWLVIALNLVAISIEMATILVHPTPNLKVFGISFARNLFFIFVALSFNISIDFSWAILLIVPVYLAVIMKAKKVMPIKEAFFMAPVAAGLYLNLMMIPIGRSTIPVQNVKVYQGKKPFNTLDRYHARVTFETGDDKARSLIVPPGQEDLRQVTVINGLLGNKILLL